MLIKREKHVMTAYSCIFYGHLWLKISKIIQFFTQVLKKTYKHHLYSTMEHPPLRKSPGTSLQPIAVDRGDGLDGGGAITMGKPQQSPVIKRQGKNILITTQTSGKASAKVA